MVDRLDVVAVEVAEEHAVVAGVVLRPQPRSVQDLGASRDRCAMDLLDRHAGRGGEGDVDLSVGRAGGRPEPEVRETGRPGEPDRRRAVTVVAPAQRRGRGTDRSRRACHNLG